MKQCVLKFVGSVSLLAHCGNPVFAFDVVPGTSVSSRERSLQTQLTCPCRTGTCNVTLVFPVAARAHQDLLVRKTQLACELAQKKMGATLRDDFAIFFDDRPVDHNGLTTVIPTNRITVHLESPELESSIGLGRDFLLETLVHELSHMIVTQQRAGAFAFLDHVVGNSSRPLGAWPRWMHEGMAVWTEAIVGGRPESGMIDFDVRKYAEYFARAKVHPLTTSDLDGTYHSRQVEPGTVPYHFGYLLMKAWEERMGDGQPFSWGSRFENWAHSLGVSFRVMFREDAKIPLEQFFERERDAWSRASITVPSSRFRLELARAPHIDGPFRMVLRSANGSLFNSVSWIERSGKRQADSILRGRLDEGRIVSLRWRRSFSSPASSFYLGDAWLVLFSQMPSLSKDHLLRGLDFPRKLLATFDDDGRELCRFTQLPDRVREIAVHQNHLAWIRTLPDLGTQVVERTTFNDSCEFAGTHEVARSRVPFERLSGLWIDSTRHALSRSRSVAPYEVVEFDGKEFSSDSPLSQGYPWGKQFVMHRFGRDAFSAGVVREANGADTYRVYPSATGSTRSAPASLLGPEKKGGLLLKESFWDEDRITLVQSGEEPETSYAMHTTKLAETTSSPETLPETPSAPATEATVYSPWRSLRPEFWLPTLLAYSEGYSLYGQTFYADLRGEYSGNFLLGYDSYPRRPFFSTQFTRKGFTSLPFAALTAALYSSPSTVFRNSQLTVLDRFGGTLGADLALAFPVSGLRLGFTPTLRYENFRGHGAFADRNYLSPALSASFYSAHAQSSSSTDFRLADIRNAFLTQGKFRWVQRAEWTANLQGQVALRRVGLSLRADYAATDPRNYPLSFFEFGGQYSFATSLPQYVSRGFPPRLGTAKELIRVEGQIGFPLGTLRSGASFSRVRFGELEGRLVGESVTFAPFNVSRFALGRGYFTSLGAELNLFGALSQYVKYSGVLGFYRGLGDYGENRLALRLSSYLDL